MRTIRDWLLGWYETFHIMIFDRATYRFMRDLTLDPEEFGAEFTEVDGPEDAS